MADAYSSVAPGSPSGGKKKDKGKEDKKEEVDDFGYTKAERKSQEEELAKLDAIRKKRKKGQLYIKDGVWKYSGGPGVKSERNPKQGKEDNSRDTKRTSAAKEDDTLDDFGYTKAERKSQAEELAKLDASRGKRRGRVFQRQQFDDAISENTAPILNPVAARVLDLVNSKLDAISELSNSPARNEQQPPQPSREIVELKLGAATLSGDRQNVDTFIEELQRAGLTAE
jgi:hypothetical protein